TARGDAGRAVRPTRDGHRAAARGTRGGLLARRAARGAPCRRRWRGLAEPGDDQGQANRERAAALLRGAQAALAPASADASGTRTVERAARLPRQVKAGLSRTRWRRSRVG